MAHSYKLHLLLLMAGIAAVGIQSLMLSPVLPDIAAGLAASPARIGFAVGAYGIGVAVAALWVAPRMGQWQKGAAIRKAFSVLALGLTACALAPLWQVLAAGQFVAGLACGVVIPTTYAFTSDLAPPAERSQALGRVLTGWSLAMVAGVPLAAALAHFVGWRGAFATVALISAAMVALLFTVPGAASQPMPRIRYADIFTVPRVVIGYTATFAYMIGFYQTYTFIGDHVRHVSDQGVLVAAIIPLSYGLGFGAAMLLDRQIDRIGAARVLPVALGVVGLNYIVLPFAMQNWIVAMLYPALWGVANHICMTSLVAFMSGLSSEHRSGIMGLFTFVTYASVGIAGAVYGTVYEQSGFAAVCFAAAAGAIAVAGLTAAVLQQRAA
jgi:predicted MFS family arabinose efflux permease